MKNKYKYTVLILATVLIISFLCAFPSAAVENTTFKPTIEGSYIFGIPEKTTFDKLADVMPKTILGIYTADNAPVLSGSSTYIGTGFTVSLNGNAYTAVVLGDVNGDGVISAIDYQFVKRLYIRILTLSDEAKLLAAGDENLDGRIKAVKYLIVKRHVLGSYNMNTNYTVPVTAPTDDESGWTSGWF